MGAAVTQLHMLTGDSLGSSISCAADAQGAWLGLHSAAA